MLARAELVRLGIAANQISTIAKGESQSLVPTADGVRESQNCHVEIVFPQPGHPRSLIRPGCSNREGGSETRPFRFAGSGRRLPAG